MFNARKAQSFLEDTNPYGKKGFVVKSNSNINGKHPVKCQDGKYQNLKEVIFIAIADCIIFPEKKAYKSDHIILDKISHEHDLRDFSFTFIELPKFEKDKIEELDGIVEKWCYYFKHL